MITGMMQVASFNSLPQYVITVIYRIAQAGTYQRSHGTLLQTGNRYCPQ